MTDDPYSVELQLPYEHVTVSLGHGWGCYDMACAACGHEWLMVAPLGSRGYTCPTCGYHDGDWVSLGCVDGDAPPSDGPWLTGWHEIAGVEIGPSGIWRLPALHVPCVQLGRRARRRLWRRK